MRGMPSMPKLVIRRAASRSTRSVLVSAWWNEYHTAPLRRRSISPSAALDRLDAVVKRAHLCMAVPGMGPPSAGGGRRSRALYALGVLVVAVLPARAAAFGLDDVAEKARRLAAEPFEDAKGRVPDW